MGALYDQPEQSAGAKSLRGRYDIERVEQASSDST
jgi:hypothetical protein